VRVCLISPGATSLFFPDSPPAHGGAETQFYLIARELARRPAFDVHMIVNGAWRHPPETRDGIALHFMPFTPGLNAKIRFQRLLFAIGAEAYLQRGVGSLTKEIAFFCLWRRRRFFYWMSSDLEADPTINAMGVDRAASFVWGMLRADTIVAQTRRQAETLKARYGRDSLVIPNGFPPRDRPPGPRDGVLWVGRFIRLKRPELFIELARRTPEEHFVMLAPTPQRAEAREFLERWKPQMDGLPNLEHNPGVSLDETQGFFDRAKLLVNTSEYEGFPNTFVQAMWSATPIASLKFDPDGAIAERGLGVAPARDFDAFAQQAAALLRDPARLAQCGANAYARAQSHHDLAKNVSLLVSRVLAP